VAKESPCLATCSSAAVNGASLAAPRAALVMSGSGRDRSVAAGSAVALRLSLGMPVVCSA
jgi:hypothetical protein